MKKNTRTTTAYLPSDTAGNAPESAGQCLTIDPLTLATLDFGLFLSLRKLGTGRERICAALGLSPLDFDYISALAE